jgi:hypothetical protein
MLRRATFAIALVILPATAADASSCGQASELTAARARWTAVRQSRTDDSDKICRAYGNYFYEAVVTRQTASLCEDSVNRQRNLEMLDAEIDAFNNLIAKQCMSARDERRLYCEGAVIRRAVSIQSVAKPVGMRLSSRPSALSASTRVFDALWRESRDP